MYTVKQVARLAGVTPRTLHFYDEIDLLKPSRVAENGYRYYDEQALLRLQQVLLYRELDIPLDQIKRILGRSNFDVLTALESHISALDQRIARLQRLKVTVDRTIQGMRGEATMTNAYLFEGFSEEQKAEYEKEAMQIYDPEIVKASSRRWKHYSAEEKQSIRTEGNAVYQAILDAMPKGAASPEAQAGVEQWRKHMAFFWEPDDVQLLGLADLYNEDLRFKANFDKADPRLAEFIREAVGIYVKRRSKSST